MKTMLRMLLATMVLSMGCGPLTPEEEAGQAPSSHKDALMAGGGGPSSGGSSCSEPPLQCSGDAAHRAVYPGCRVTCGAGQAAMCLSGDCQFHSAPGCVCLDRPGGGGGIVIY